MRKDYNRGEDRAEPGTVSTSFTVAYPVTSVIPSEARDLGVGPGDIDVAGKNLDPSLRSG
jgi:hypothetical protein